MKKDEICKRFLFLPVTIIVVSVLCILFNGYSRLFPKQDECKTETVAENITVENKKRIYKEVKKIKADEPKIDINHATVDDFIRLPGIGVIKAEMIVSQRSKMKGFRTLKDIMCVDGISVGIFENLKSFITITDY